MDALSGAARDHAMRMLSAAEERLNDAAILEESARTRSDSASLLSVLALEILLKCARFMDSGAHPKSHDYVAAWKKLHVQTREEVLLKAKLRMPGHADLSDVEELLRIFRRAFEKARYQYEAYEGQSAAEVEARGDAWVANGSRLADADFVYRPNELCALTFGFRHHIRCRLKLVDDGIEASF